MLDYLFMNKMNQKGRKSYMIGSLIMGLIIIIGWIALGEFGNDDQYGVVVALLIVFIVGWGFYCINKWPKSLSYCPWCDQPNDTPEKKEYICHSCNKKFSMGKASRISKIEV